MGIKSNSKQNYKAGGQKKSLNLEDYKRRHGHN